MCLAAGIRPDPLGKLTALPRSPSWILRIGGGGAGREKGKGKDEGKERG